jgi:hypothetical protein
MFRISTVLWTIICVASACAPGDPGQPQICTPNATDCQGEEVVKCDPSGTAWVSLGQCAPGASCSMGQCQTDERYCGSGVCSLDENCSTCPADCGSCCGNGQCETGYSETESTCPADCGSVPTCGDGVCDANINENCSTCSADCGTCCGDGKCSSEYGETESNCSADCKPVDACGDGVCSAVAGETCNSCTLDCGSCCGNGSCENQYGETTATCATDCPPVDFCGDNTCNAATGETTANCPTDCPATAYCGDGNIDATNAEECDGTALNNTSCTDLGYTVGTLSCTASCQFDTSACQSVVSWSTAIGGSQSEYAYDMKVDAAGNTYLAGSFLDEVTFGSTTLVSKGGNDAYVAKLSPSGDVLWAKSAGGTGGDVALAVAVDSAGNVYTTGYFKQQATFDNKSVTGTATLGSFYLAKYSATGQLLWVSTGDGSKWSGGRVLAVDSSGNPIVGGMLWETATFGNTSLVTKGKGDVFVAKYSSDGVFGWATSFGGTEYDLVNDMVVNGADEIFLAGYFQNTLVGVTDVFGSTLTAKGKKDAFVLKLSAVGAVKWGDSLGSTADDSANGIAFDKNGDIVCVGSFEGTVQFNSTSFVPDGGEDSYMLKLSALLGMRSSISHITGAGETAAEAIAVDPQNNAYITGSFTGQMTRGGTTLSSLGGEDTFVYKYDLTAKKTDWSKSGGGTNEVLPRAIAVDGLGAIRVAGSFKGTSTFDGSQHSSNGERDVFLWSPVND